MKSVAVLLVCLIGSTSALASEVSQYEQAYLDCIDYGHRPVSAEKDKACREQAAAQTENDNGQVIPPYPVPKGEVRIDALKEIELTENLLLTAYVQKGEEKATVYGNGDWRAEVKCNLTASNVKLSKFELLKTEYPGGTGARLYISPKESMTLKYKTSLQGVDTEEPWCNGEPEFCNGKPYYVYRTQIFATDKKGNNWSLNCVAPFSRPVFASDVKINGIKIK